MTKLNKNTKKAQAFIKAYNNAPLYRDLRDCYTNYSYNKMHAYEDCMQFVKDFDGYDYTIVSYNTNIFIFAFLFVDDSGNEVLCYITPYNNYVIQLD